MAEKPLGPYTLAADYALRKFLGPPKRRELPIDKALEVAAKIRATRGRVVRWYASVNGVCVVCGKHADRREVFSIQMPPGATAADYIEARGKLKRQAAAWRKRPIRHLKCEVSDG